MKTITLKQVARSQKEVIEARQEDNRFIGDYEIIDNFTKTDYDITYLVDTDLTGGNKSGDSDKYFKSIGLIDNDMFLLTCKVSTFNGEEQHQFSTQQLTLQGLNFYTKNSEVDYSEFYNSYLERLGYSFTIQDVKEIGEFKPEFNNCTILQFKDEEENEHYITVNKLNQLSKITVKQSARQVKSKSSAQGNPFA